MDGGAMRLKVASIGEARTLGYAEHGVAAGSPFLFACCVTGWCRRRSGCNDFNPR